MTNVNRTALFAGVSLAAAGIVMLAGSAEGAARDAIAQAVRLWPLAIIALGVALLVRRTPYALVGTLIAATLMGLVVGGAVVAAPDVHGYCADGDVSTAPTRTGSFTERATVDLALDCWDLHVSTTEGTAWELLCRIADDILADVEAHVEADVAASEFNGLVRVGDAWETPDFSTATHRAELSASARAGSVVVNPAGGCK